MPNRCINIDWLEVYCQESPINFPHDADYFMRKGYIVKVRDYGTRQYSEMFTICDQRGDGFIEVRRKPVAGGMAGKVKGIFSDFSCHIKLVNRYCYADNAIELFYNFLKAHQYEIVRLFRLDLALDFEKFDDGTKPNDFVKRYLKGIFTKVNQGSISAHGTDRWEERCWNSLSWGAPKSMVSTKLYLKTLELKQAKDKPYIRYAWLCAGLVDDFQNMTKHKPDGTLYTPDIWRLEFSIRSSAKGWVVLEDCAGKKTRTFAVEHRLESYALKENQLQAFEMLCKHYFHFKYYESGKRKDLCKDKELFHFHQWDGTYKLERLLTDKPKDRTIESLKHRLQNYRNTHLDTNVRKACDILIQACESEQLRNAVPMFDRNEHDLLQMIVSRRLSNYDEDFATSLEVCKAMLSMQHEIW